MLIISKYMDIFNTSIYFSPIWANIFLVVVEAYKFQDYMHLKTIKTFQRSKLLKSQKPLLKLFAFKFIHILKI